MHVYVILAEEHKPIFSIFNHHQQVYEALVFQMPVLHKHVQRYAPFYLAAFTSTMLDFEINDFWNWFAKNSEKLQSDKYDPSLLEKLDETISSWKLCWEIGSGFIKQNSLTISPNGDRKLIKRTNKIIASAPQLDNWEFYSFKQRKDNWDKAKLLDSNMEISAKNWTYVLLKYQDDATEILIKADNLNAFSTETKEIAVDLVLTNLLGEELKMQKIDFIDIVDTFEDNKRVTKLKYLPAHLDRTQNGA